MVDGRSCEYRREVQKKRMMKSVRKDVNVGNWQASVVGSGIVNEGAMRSVRKEVDVEKH